MDELHLTLERLRKAKCPEDVFPWSAMEPGVRHDYRLLARLVHPDRNSNSAAAGEATALLNDIYREALKRITDGTWGKRLPLLGKEPLTIEGHTVERTALIGDIADVYFGEDVVVKVARSADDADLLRAERAALQTLARIKGPVSAGVPRIIGSAKVAGLSGWNREANILPRLAGFHTAEVVRSLLGSVDMRTLVWMFKRLLKMLEAVHGLGLVHGAVLPPHALFYPDNDGHSEIDERKHALRLIDWCYSVKYAERTRLSAWVPKWEAFYPPEIIAKSSIAPSSDLYMAANLIIYLGGVGKIPAPFQRVLDGCRIPDSGKRYQKASDVFADWIIAAGHIYGESRWHPFELPISSL